MFQVLDQLRNAGGTEVGFEISFVRETVRGDAIDSAQGVAAPEIHGSLDGIGDRAWSLNEFAVHVDYIKIAVGRVGEIARTKPWIGRGQEFPLPLFGRAAGNESDAIGRQDIAMDQVST